MVSHKDHKTVYYLLPVPGPSDFRRSGSFVVLVFLFFRLALLLLLICAFTAAAVIAARCCRIIAVGRNLGDIYRHRVERLEVLFIPTTGENEFN